MNEHVIHKQVMTTKEVVEYTGLSHKEILRLTHEGILKHLRGCRKPFKYSWHNVEKWLRGDE